MKKLLVYYLFTLVSLVSYAQNGVETTNSGLTRNTINLKTLKFIGTVDERYQSFNVEMCEVIGGDFWIPYRLIDSVRKNTNKTGISALKWRIKPINLYEKKLRNLASALGPTYVRVSGTWANGVYFQNNDEPTLTSPPRGFKNILTRQQWKGVVDFCKAVDGKLVSSFPISDGMRDEQGTWQPHQVKAILDYTKSIGGEISAAEFFNEPSHASHGDAPKGYTGGDFAQEFALFKSFVAKAAPTMTILGPGSTGESILPSGLDLSVDALLSPSPKPTFDVFTYHYYGTVSRRCGGSQKPEFALSTEWLSKTEKGLEFYQRARDNYTPSVPIWLTETAESACGGNPWAATYIDSFRYLEQLGRLAKKGVQVVMHNTLAQSEYALLDEETHDPRPNYWAALLWNKLMGSQVFDGGRLEAGVDLFVHSAKKRPGGKSVLIINTNEKATAVTIPQEAIHYLFTSSELLAKKVNLNGTELTLTKDNNIPPIEGKKVRKGVVDLPAHSILFLEFSK